MKFIKNLIIYVLLPFLVASVLSLFVLNFLGVKLPENVRNVLPSIAVFGDNSDKKSDESILKGLETTIQEQQDKIESLEETIDEKNSQLDEKTSIIEGYRKLEVNEDVTSSTESDNEENKQVIKIIQEMKAEDAALVLLSMEDQESSAILTGLEQSFVAEILSEMEPEQAAHYLELIKD